MVDPKSPAPQAPNYVLPLWIAAIALVTIAGLLVVLVSRPADSKANTQPVKTFAARQANMERTSPLSPVAIIPPVRIAGAARAPAQPLTASNNLENTLQSSATDTVQAPIPPSPTPEDLRLATTVSAPIVPAVRATRVTELSGRVVLRGTPPPEIPLAMDPVCGQLHSKPATTRHYVVSPDGGLANVFVYITGGVTGIYAVPAEVPVIDQVDCQYSPYVLGVMTGQMFRVKNSDPMLHNVHLTPKVPGNLERNIAQPLQGMFTDFSLANPEVLLRIKCDVHNWMFAYVGVVPHPFFVVTDADGRFTIPGLPPGEYTIEAYHLKTHQANRGVSQRIVLDEGGRRVMEIAIKLQ